MGDPKCNISLICRHTSMAWLMQSFFSQKPLLLHLLLVQVETEMSTQVDTYSAFNGESFKGSKLIIGAAVLPSILPKAGPGYRGC